MKRIKFEIQSNFKFVDKIKGDLNFNFSDTFKNKNKRNEWNQPTKNSNNQNDNKSSFFACDFFVGYLLSRFDWLLEQIK